jgi:hypothetical protein
MKRAIFIVAIGLAFCGTASAQAPTSINPAKQAPSTAALVRLAPAIATQVPPAPAPLPTTIVPFGCNARAGSVCYFRIFYQRGDRIVILAAGMKDKVPGVTIGGSYCMTLDKAPVYKCTRKVINEKSNG